jgi:hypothetical protein
MLRFKVHEGHCEAFEVSTVCIEIIDVVDRESSNVGAHLHHATTSASSHPIHYHVFPPKKQTISSLA